MQRTLSIIKPDAVERNLVGSILEKIEQGGLKIVAIKMKQLSKQEAAGFYAVHKDRPFFDELITFMSRSKVVISVLEGDQAVEKYREIMGATDPTKAANGTIRKDFAKSIGENSVHGSDSEQNALTEIAFFFNGCQLL